MKPKVWSADYFDGLESVLYSLDRYTSVCSAMRADVLATLFLVRRFHVVYSPHVGRESQPAATRYMDKYGPLMASITLEVDFTKLSGGWKPGAANLKAETALKGVKKLVEGFVRSQLTRQGTSIQDFRVLVRRYYGFRPAPGPANPNPATCQCDKPTTTTVQLDHPPPPTQYTPNAQITQTLSPLKSLGPLVATLTITGAPKAFATELIAALWGSNKLLLASDPAQRAAHVTYRESAREYRLFPGASGRPGGARGAVVACGVGCGDSGHDNDDDDENENEKVGGGRMAVVKCKKTGREWEGLYGCRLLPLGGCGDQGGDGKGNVRGRNLKRRGKSIRMGRRWFLRGSGGAWWLALRPLANAKGEDNRGLEAGVSAVTQGLLRRANSAGRKGLFGYC